MGWVRNYLKLGRGETPPRFGPSNPSGGSYSFFSAAAYIYDMWHWPLPEKANIPSTGEAGSFWEDRKDRRHCGVDLYAREWTEVSAVESGRILSITIFTTPNLVPYWNLTYSILVEAKSGLHRYCELGSAAVSPGARLEPTK